MTEKEMRELDVWIAERSMGWKKTGLYEIRSSGQFCLHGTDVLIHQHGKQVRLFKPTTDRADAMEVLERCAKKTEHGDCIYVGFADPEWICGWSDTASGESFEGTAATLPLAVALFARNLFQK